MTGPSGSPEAPSVGEENVVMTSVAEEAPPRRLMITKMQLENFKSYANVIEVGPFHKCFSAVVGPNGSGKSNVIDAMLFVFGKRAKQLRLKKVSELIHKSDGYQPDFARVSVFFQEIIDISEDEYEVVPNTECVVSRIARKDNSSVYKIDGRNCQFKDVAAFLGSKGIDLDNNRFLILQGEVEMISMMPPKDDGLLEYLEDIIGSNKFVEETEQVAQQVEALSVQRQEKLNRVKAVEKEKDALEGAKLEAQSLLQKEREIRRQQNILYQIHNKDATLDKQDCEAALERARQKLQSEREKNAVEAERVQEIEAGLKAQQDEYKTVHEELKQSQEEFALFERKDVKLKTQIKQQSTKGKKLEAKIESETKALEDAIAQGEAAKESIPKLEQEVEQLKEHKVEEDAKLEEIEDSLSGVMNQIRAELKEKEQELAPIREEMGVLDANLQSAKAEVESLEAATTRAKQDLQAKEDELAHLDEKQNAAREELASCQDELKQATGRLADAEREDKLFADKETKLASKQKDLRVRLEQANELKSAKSNRRSPVVDHILRASKKGGELASAGVLGRLGDLATIAEEYDVAVSTASGSAMDQIVVHTTVGAQKCIEFLRKHNLGRANFIPLEKCMKGAHDRAVETPLGSTRLFDLITPLNPIVTPAIFKAVGNTLVAPDLDTATHWAFPDGEDRNGKRWRVVTIDGKLIDASGSMSGGGKRVRRGAMKLANARVAKTANDDDEEEEDAMNCKELEDKAKYTQQLLLECRKRRSELEKEVRSLKSRIKVLETKLPKLAKSIGDFDLTREQLTQVIPEMRSRCDLSPQDAAKLVELKKVVEKRESEMSSSKEIASKLEAEASALQQKIVDAGGSKLKKQKDKCDKIKKTLKDTEKALIAANLKITKMEKVAAKARESIETAKVELEQCKATREELKAERTAMEAEALKVMESFEDVKGREAVKRAALEEVTKELEELRAAQSKIKVVEIELVSKVSEWERKVAECDEYIQKWTTALDKLHARAEEEDEDCLSDDEEDAEPTPPADAATDDDGDVEMKESEESQPANKSSLPTYSFEALDKYSKDAIKENISVLETERDSIAKNANMGAIAEYRKKEADYLSRVAELDAVTEERNAVRNKHDELRRKRLEMFMDGFGKITLKLKEMYQMITLGGDAELELVDSLDPFSEGIVFSVRPPKKSWKNICNLSGGEKTLSSLALVFALHHFKPTPLYVMDEIDAALDFKNVSIVANYIKERTKNAQFVIISLRNNMFELADRLVGIYKINNCTGSVTINASAFGVDGNRNSIGGSTPALSEKTNKGEKEAPISAKMSSRRLAIEDGETVDAEED